MHHEDYKIYMNNFLHYYSMVQRFSANFSFQKSADRRNRVSWGASFLDVLFEDYPIPMRPPIAMTLWQWLASEVVTLSEVRSLLDHCLALFWGSLRGLLIQQRLVGYKMSEPHQRPLMYDSMDSSRIWRKTALNAAAFHQTQHVQLASFRTIIASVN